MTICNACRYCEGHCAVFPAMELRLAFGAADLEYLANLCHDCGACYHHCQYAPRRTNSRSTPRVFAELRAQTYRDCCWPAFLTPLLERNGLAVSLIATACLVLFLGSAPSCWSSLRRCSPRMPARARSTRSFRTTSW